MTSRAAAPILLVAIACAGPAAQRSGAPQPPIGVAFAQDTSAPQKKAKKLICDVERDTGSHIAQRVCYVVTEGIDPHDMTIEENRLRPAVQRMEPGKK